MSSVPPESPKPGPQHPFGEASGSNPFSGQPPLDPYGPGSMPPPPGHDPALELMVPINTSAWALAAGYLGLLSLGLCFLGPFAVLCGIMGLRDIRRRPGVRGTVRSVLGIVFGLLGSLGLAFLLVAITAENL